LLNVVGIRWFGRVLGKLVWRGEDPVDQDNLSRSSDARYGHDVSPVTGRVALLQSKSAIDTIASKGRRDAGMRRASRCDGRGDSQLTSPVKIQPKS
jgi:hypothetical protein